MCVRMRAQACNRTAPCCTMDVAKMELPVSPACKPLLQSISINGAIIPHSWGQYDTFTTIKWTILNQ